MAQEGPIASEIVKKFCLEKEQRTRDKATTSETVGTPAHHATQQVPPIDLVPPVAKRKNKCKKESKRRSTPR